MTNGSNGEPKRRSDAVGSRTTNHEPQPHARGCAPICEHFARATSSVADARLDILCAQNVWKAALAPAPAAIGVRRTKPCACLEAARANCHQRQPSPRGRRRRARPVPRTNGETRAPHNAATLALAGGAHRELHGGESERSESAVSAWRFRACARRPSPGQSGAEGSPASRHRILRLAGMTQASLLRIHRGILVKADATARRIVPPAPRHAFSACCHQPRR